MKTAIFYIALFILSIVAFNANADMDYFETGRAERYVDEHLDEFDAETVEYCKKNIYIGEIAIQMRDEGLTLDDAMADLSNSAANIKKKHNRAMPVSIYLEMQRMIRTVYRHPNMTPDEYNRQFFAECLLMGGY